MENYYNVVDVGYCDLQHLLYFMDADYCTSGVYGWNADIYKINQNTCIVTGYRPFGNIYASYNGICKKYDDKAEKIIRSDLKFETKKNKIQKLLNQFIDESLKLKK